MVSLNAGKFILVGATCGLLAAAVHVSTLIERRQAELGPASHCAVCTAASGAALELARLEQRVAAAALPGSPVGAADVALRFDALRRASAGLGAPDAAGLWAEDPDALAIRRRLDAALADTAPLLDGSAHPEAAGTALRLLAPLDFDLSRLSAEADRYGEARAARARAELSRLYAVFTAVLAALVAFGAGLVWLLVRQNRRLGAARDRLAASRADLEAASLGLAAAHAETSTVNAELQARNAALDRRDRELGLQNERFDAALDNMPLALCMVDAADRLVLYNRRFAGLFELDFAPIPGLLFADVVALARGPRLAQVHARQRAFAAREGETESFVEDLAPAAVALADARLTLSVTHRTMPDGGWVATYEDVSHRRRAEARIAHMARHDPLTDLANRAFFAEQVDAAVADAARRGGSVAVHCLDVDRMREVNETFGHGAGDALLRDVARRLLAEADGGAVARLAGDEFAVLQAGAGPAEASALAGRLGRALQVPFASGGAQVAISASIGHASLPADAPDAGGLLRVAALALAEAKAAGRGAVLAFAPDMDAARRARRALEADLGRALAGNEFELHFQPLVDVRRLAVTGFEALLRWRHPVRGLVSPAEFVPVAEETGLIGAIGAWVLDAACREAASWTGGQTVAVNLSPAQFGEADLSATVAGALARSGLDARRLELEITESVPLGDDSLAVLHALRARGIRIAMDDFGTGYSSLSYLRRFPFDKIKIDQSFVRDLASRPDCLEIVRSIAALAHGLGMVTTAEGVETAEQFARLRAAGCDQAQGYHFGRPQPAGRLAFAVAAEAAA